MKSTRILISGPESTGKSELCQALASHYGGRIIPEYARTYIEQLGRPYGYQDVAHIAQQQAMEYRASLQVEGPVFFDTWLIITRVWFEEVFKKWPKNIDDQIRSASFDLVLVCAPDLPWIPDPVRENGGKRREVLFEKYQERMKQFGMRYEIVQGTGKRRIQHALTMIDKKLKYATR